MLLLLAVNYESSPVESRACQVSSTKHVLITGLEEGSRAQSDKPGNEPRLPTSKFPQCFLPAPGSTNRRRKRKREREKKYWKYTSWLGAEAYAKLNSKKKQLDQTNLTHDQNKNSICFSQLNSLLMPSLLPFPPSPEVLWWSSWGVIETLRFLSFNLWQYLRELYYCPSLAQPCNPNSTILGFLVSGFTTSWANLLHSPYPHLWDYGKKNKKLDLSHSHNSIPLAFWNLFLSWNISCVLKL